MTKENKARLIKFLWNLVTSFVHIDIQIVKRCFRVEVNPFGCFVGCLGAWLTYF